jgi:hypothetical protein
MKFLGIVFFLSLAFFLQCEKGVSDAPDKTNVSAVKTASADSTPEPTELKTMNEDFSSKGTKDEIEYRIAGRLQKKGRYEGIDYPNDNIVIEYELKNTGTKNFILFNRGHSSDGAAFVYVEPLTNGTVELSLKAFTEPADKNCPARFVAVLPRGAWLKAGETVRDKVFVELPLKTKTPFDDCAPKTEVPAGAAKIKFCLGFQEAAAKDVKIDAEGNILPAPNTGKQQFLCSESFDIK